MQLLVSALGLGNAVGLNAVISKALGRKDKEEVRRAAGIIHGNEQHDSDNGKTGCSATYFCRNIQQVWKSGSVMD